VLRRREGVAPARAHLPVIDNRRAVCKGRGVWVGRGVGVVACVVAIAISPAFALVARLMPRRRQREIVSTVRRRCATRFVAWVDARPAKYCRAKRDSACTVEKKSSAVTRVRRRTRMPCIIAGTVCMGSGSAGI